MYDVLLARSLFGRGARLALAAYLLVVIVVALAAGQRSFVLIMLTAGMLFLGIPLRYIYLRLFRPFTHPVQRWRGESDPEDARAGSDAGNDSAGADANSAAPLRAAAAGEPNMPICGSPAGCGKLWSRSEVTATGLFTVLTLLAFSPLALVETLFSEEPVPFMVFGYNFLGSLILLVLSCCLVDLIDLGKGVVLLSRTDPDKRTPWTQFFFLSAKRNHTQAKAGLALFTYLLMLAVTLSLSYSTPEVQEVEIFIDRLPECMDGYRVLFISDVHAGPLVGRAEITRLVAQANQIDPDAVFLGGDFADGPVRNIGGIVTPFGDLAAPDGVYYVVGNHEYLHGGSGPEWMARFAELGVTPLYNSHTRVAESANCTGIDVLGVDDLSQNASVAGAMIGRDLDRVAVLLAHQPSVSRESVDLGVDLQISGHTHGGQIWPMHALSLPLNTHFAGLARDGDSWVYVSTGAFGWGPRTRLGCRNNIDLLVLRAAPAESAPQLSVAPSIVWGWFSFPFVIITLGLCVACGPNRRRNAKLHASAY